MEQYKVIDETSVEIGADRKNDRSVSRKNVDCLSIPVYFKLNEEAGVAELPDLLFVEAYDIYLGDGKGEKAVVLDISKLVLPLTKLVEKKMSDQFDYVRFLCFGGDFAIKNGTRLDFALRPKLSMASAQYFSFRFDGGSWHRVSDADSPN